MEGTIIIPVIDTERGTFSYNGREISREDYDDMVMDRFNRTNARVSQFVNNMSRGISNVQSRWGVREVANDTDVPDTYYDYCESQAFIQDSRRNDITEDEILSHVTDGKMFILIVNINPNTVNEEAESELRFWMDDSRRVHEDISLTDNKVKLMRLPVRDLGIKLDGKNYVMNGCKILENYSDRKYPYHFAFIVTKIIENR